MAKIHDGATGAVVLRLLRMRPDATCSGASFPVRNAPLIRLLPRETRQVRSCLSIRVVSAA